MTPEQVLTYVMLVLSGATPNGISRVAERRP